MILVTLCCGAIKYDLDVQQTYLSFMFANIPKAGLLNKSSCFAPALRVTKFTNVKHMIFVVLLKLDLDIQQTHL
jgi:hypothetical protein